MTRWLVVVIALFGCHKDKTSSSATAGTPVSTAELDALWAKAPDNAMVGIVVSPRAITMCEHAWHDIHAFLKTLPDFAPADQEMTEALAGVGLTPDFTLADVGLGPAKGAAMFVADHGHAVVTILPVVDRDKFLAKVKGTKGADVDKIDRSSCKMIDGGFYACADAVADLARLGKGKLRPSLDAAKARGDIEVVAVDPVRAAGVVQLERGAFVARGTIAGVDALYTSKLGAPHATGVDLEHASGFATLDLRSLLGDVPELPLVEGVTTTDLVKSIAGPLAVTISSGELGLEATLPLSDTGAAKKLIEHCGDLPAVLGAKLDGGKCRFPVPQVNVDALAYVDGNALRFSVNPGGTAKKVPASAAGTDLAKGQWSAAFWGRGTLLAPTPAQGGMPFGDAPGDAATVIRVMTMLDELGLGVRVDGDKLDVLWTVRTAWANPDDVVAKLLAVDPAQVVAGKGGELGKAIADASPNSPFAADYKSGYGGLLVPTAIVGMMAAVAVPAFMSYMDRSRHGAPLDDPDGPSDPGGPVRIPDGP